MCTYVFTVHYFRRSVNRINAIAKHGWLTGLTGRLALEQDSTSHCWFATQLRSRRRRDCLERKLIIWNRSCATALELDLGCVEVEDVGSSPGQLSRYVGPRCRPFVMYCTIKYRTGTVPKPFLSLFPEQPSFSPSLSLPLSPLSFYRLPCPFRCVGSESENAVANTRR